MFKEETKELKMSNEFKKKIEMICKFACVKYELINGNIISIKNTNLACVRPHILKVKGNDYLLFEDSNIVFIIGLNRFEGQSLMLLLFLILKIMELWSRFNQF